MSHKDHLNKCVWTIDVEIGGDYLSILCFVDLHALIVRLAIGNLRSHCEPFNAWLLYAKKKKKDTGKYRREERRDRGTEQR